MRHLLSPGGRGALTRLVARRPLVALDFDGTLAPIVPDRHRGAMRATTRAHLRRLASILPCAVVSGRSRADVLRRLGSLRLAYVSGSHGIEPSPAKRTAAREVARWKGLLASALQDVEGVVVEDKKYSLAVHYRNARRKARVRAAVRRVAGSLRGVRLIPGKQVVNVVPQGAPTKGTAVATACRRLRCGAVMYIGDDATDEDVFSLVARYPLLTVRVGRSSKSAAQYYLRNQKEVDPMLEALYGAASARTGLGR